MFIKLHSFLKLLASAIFVCFGIFISSVWVRCTWMSSVKILIVKGIIKGCFHDTIMLSCFVWWVFGCFVLWVGAALAHSGGGVLGYLRVLPCCLCWDLSQQPSVPQPDPLQAELLTPWCLEIVELPRKIQDSCMDCFNLKIKIYYFLSWSMFLKSKYLPIKGINHKRKQWTLRHL